MRGGFGGMADDEYSVAPADETIRSFEDFVKQLNSAELNIELYKEIPFGKTNVLFYEQKRDELLKDYPQWIQMAKEKKEKDRQDKDEKDRKETELQEKIKEENIKKYGSLENMWKIKQEEEEERRAAKMRMMDAGYY
jgi:hypothetical protein